MVQNKYLINFKFSPALYSIWHRKHFFDLCLFRKVPMENNVKKKIVMSCLVLPLKIQKKIK